MLSFFSKLLFLIKKPQIVVVENKEIAEAIFNLLSKYFKVGKFGEKWPGFFDILKNEILILAVTNIDIEFLSKKSRRSILIINQINETVVKLIKTLRQDDYLILNFDDVEVRNSKKEAVSNILTFGFYEGADVQATDISQENGIINFKLNYGGGFVPVWLNSVSETKLEESEIREEIYPKLVAVAVGIILGLNLVEISRGLK